MFSFSYAKRPVPGNDGVWVHCWMQIICYLSFFVPFLNVHFECRHVFGYKITLNCISQLEVILLNRFGLLFGNLLIFFCIYFYFFRVCCVFRVFFVCRLENVAISSLACALVQSRIKALRDSTSASKGKLAEKQWRRSPMMMVLITIYFLTAFIVIVKQ